jgi:hypothetical protein
MAALNAAECHCQEQERNYATPFHLPLATLARPTLSRSA